MQEYTALLDVVTACAKNGVPQFTEWKSSFNGVARVLELGYDIPQKLPSPPWAAASLIYKNETSVEQMFTFAFSEEIANTIQSGITFTAELTVGTEVSAGFPGIVDVSGSITVSVGTSVEEVTTKSRAFSRAIDMPTTIPARKNVEATMMITMDKRTVGWWAKIAFTGRAKSESSRQTSTGSEDVGVDAPIENFVLNAITDNLIDTKGYKVETLSDPAEFWGNDYKFYTGDGKVAYMEGCCCKLKRGAPVPRCWSVRVLHEPSAVQM